MDLTLKHTPEGILETFRLTDEGYIGTTLFSHAKVVMLSQAVYDAMIDRIEELQYQLENNNRD